MSLAAADGLFTSILYVAVVAGLPGMSALDDGFLSTQTALSLSYTHISCSQWLRLGAYSYTDLKILLVMGGIEKNPGPSTRQQQINVARININSITSVNRIDELSQFLDVNDINPRTDGGGADIRPPPEVFRR